MKNKKKVIKNKKKVIDPLKTGARIKERRKKLHMTQDELAGAVYMNPKSISAIENGRRGVSLDSLETIATVLEVDVDYLLCKINYPRKEEQEFSNFVDHINKDAKIFNLVVELSKYSKYETVIDDRLPFIDFDSDGTHRIKQDVIIIKNSEGNTFHFTYNEYLGLCYELMDYLNFMIKHRLLYKTSLPE